MSLSLARLRRVVGWSVLAILVSIGSASSVFAQANALFSDERLGPAAALAPRGGAPNPMVKRSRNASVNLDMLRAPAAAPALTGWAALAPAAARSLDLNLFDDVNLVAFFDRMEIVPAANGAAWVGKVAGDEDSQVILAVADGVLSGTISSAGRRYSVTSDASGAYTIAEVNANAIPQDGDPIVPKLEAPAADVAPAAAPTDAGDVFDLLMYYTTQARNAAGGTAQINAIITASIAQTNSVYLQSGINLRVRLVGVLPSPVSESGDMSVDLPALRINSTVAADRDRLGADIVSLVVNSSNAGSGLGYVLGPTSVGNQSFAGSAFNVTLYYNFIGYIASLAHEMGHNMGCLHEPGNNTGGGAFSYSQGYTDPTHHFYDVMSYGLTCSGTCQQMNQFSSPTNTYNGIPSGTDTSDNVRTINNTRTTVANFRQSVTGTLGVPSNLTASASGSNVTLTWTAGAGATGYLIEAGSSSGKADLASLNTGNSATTFTAGGIASGTYYVRVSATNGATTTTGSNEAVLVVGSCTSAPSTPANPNISVTGGTFVIQWTPSARATSYLVDAGSSAGLSNLASGFDVTSGVVAVPGGQAIGGYPFQVSWSYSGLGAGSYYLRIRAKNACGTSSASSEVVATVR